MRSTALVITYVHMHHEIYCIGRHNSTMKLLLDGAKKVTPPVFYDSFIEILTQTYNDKIIRI